MKCTKLSRRHPEINKQVDPDSILNKLENYVRPAKNKSVARVKAQRRKQNEGDSVDNFVKDLNILLLDCDYDTLMTCFLTG